ncbi:MAG TPA: DegQ family serine endoprotease [Terriglobales bacterium]|jgi:serine protease Do|nr:DegQ family serine endoprotease [Terriglobales bacterium]
MKEKVVRIGYPAAILSTIVVLVIGGVLGWVIPAWAGIDNTANTVPVYISGSAPAAGPPNSMGYAAVVKPVLPAVVNISSSHLVKPQGNQLNPFFNNPFFQQFFGGQMPQPRPQREEALGSGVIVSHDGYIMTNNHVVEKGTDIKVYLSNKQEYAAKVVGTDPKTDIAVLKIQANHLSTVTFGDSSKLQVGDYALAIGDPFGIGETVTMGIVSATARSQLGIENYEDFIQTDAAINPGNSGGALINARGELIGINTAILSGRSGGNQGIGFAIPINLARYIMGQILKYGKVTRGWLGVGVQDVSAPVAKTYGVPANQGAIISDVAPNGPGAKAGLQRGDVITQLNEQPVQGANDLKLKIGELRPGTTAQLKIVRDGKPQDVSLTLGEQPQSGQQQAGAAEPQQPGLMQGVEVENLTPDILQQLGVPANTRGVVVANVAQGSPAEMAGLQRGDIIEQVNRHPVDRVSQYDREVRMAGHQSIVLLVNRGGTTAFVVVQTP